MNAASLQQKSRCEELKSETSGFTTTKLSLGNDITRPKAANCSTYPTNTPNANGMLATPRMVDSVTSPAT